MINHYIDTDTVSTQGKRHNPISNMLFHIRMKRYYKIKRKLQRKLFAYYIQTDERCVLQNLYPSIYKENNK